MQALARFMLAVKRDAEMRLIATGIMIGLIGFVLVLLVCLCLMFACAVQDKIVTRDPAEDPKSTS